MGHQRRGSLDVGRWEQEDLTPEVTAAHENARPRVKVSHYLARYTASLVPGGNIACAVASEKLSHIAAACHGISGNRVSLVSGNFPDKHLPCPKEREVGTQDLAHESKQSLGAHSCRQFACGRPRRRTGRPLTAITLEQSDKPRCQGALPSFDIHTDHDCTPKLRAPQPSTTIPVYRSDSTKDTVSRPAS